MKIVILGGHGFLGQHLNSLLSKFKKCQVLCLSRRDGYDLRNLTQTEKIFTKYQPQVVYNLAAHVGSVHYVTKFAADVVFDNMQMVLNIYEAIKRTNPKIKIINPLSNCSYPGEADIYYESQWFDGPVHESVMAYGNVKRMAYILAKCYRNQYGIKSVNLLVPNVFGPGDYIDINKTHALNGLIMRMLKAKKNNSPVFEVWGSGKPVREWGFVKDMVKVLVEASTLREDLTDPVNIAQNKGYSIKQTAKIIAKTIGYKGKLIFNTKYADGAMKKILNDRRFKKLFPHFRFTGYEEGIKETVAYYWEALKI